MKERATLVTRRDALALMAAGVGAAACAPEGAGDADAGSGANPGMAPGSDAGSGGATPIWVKDPARFVQHGTNLETRLEDLDGLLTPNDLFFVRNHAPTPVIDPAS